MRLVTPVKVTSDKRKKAILTEVKSITQPELSIKVTPKRKLKAKERKSIVKPEIQNMMIPTTSLTENTTQISVLKPVIIKRKAFVIKKKPISKGVIVSNEDDDDIDLGYPDLFDIYSNNKKSVSKQSDIRKVVKDYAQICKENHIQLKSLDKQLRDVYIEFVERIKARGLYVRKEDVSSPIYSSLDMIVMWGINPGELLKNCKMTITRRNIIQEFKRFSEYILITSKDITISEIIEVLNVDPYTYPGELSYNVRLKGLEAIKQGLMSMVCKIQVALLTIKKSNIEVKEIHEDIKKVDDLSINEKSKTLIADLDEEYKTYEMTNKEETKHDTVIQNSSIIYLPKTE